MDSLKIKQVTDQIRENIEKVIIGKSEPINLVLTALLAGGNILLEDVPGTGKTVLAKSLAKSIDSCYNRIQFTPDLLPSDITGLNYFNQKEGEFVFKPGPIFANIILADEINRATPRTQAALLECMEESQVTVDGETRILSQPFFVIATQNPIDTSGTFPLPEAQLDRFMMKISIGYPEAVGEIQILDRFNAVSPLDTLTSICSGQDIYTIQKMVPEVFIHDIIKEYIVKIVHKTRISSEISAGVSPRGTLAFAKACQAFAAISGRNYVIPEDVKYLAPYVLSHRLVMTSSYNKSVAAFEAIKTILNEVPVPTENFTKTVILES